jgi:hypothetical protein
VSDNRATTSPRPELPPGLRLYQMAIGHYVSRALFLVAKLGVADLLADGARSADELAEATETNADALRRVLRLLTSVGVFAEQESGDFGLTPLGDALRTDAPMSSRWSVMLFSGMAIQDSWRELEFCVRTGEPAIRKNDPRADPFEAMAQHPEAAGVFDRAMATFAPQTAAAVAAAYDFSPFGSVVDVGGGNGALLMGILRAYPHLRGTIFDQPHVVERAEDQLRRSGLGDRCTWVGGDFFETVPAGADAYLLKHVIHDWADERAVAILTTCHDAMPDDASLLILEGIYPARIDGSLESRGAAANDVNMLVSTGGRQRSEQQFRDLLAAAGFELRRLVPTDARLFVIEAAKA